MKSFLFAGLASTFWIAKAITTATTAGVNPWEVGKDISFAGLVWFMLGYLFPKLLERHRDERREFLEQIESERKHREDHNEKHLATLSKLGQECHSVQQAATIVMAQTKDVLTEVRSALK